MIAQPWRKVNKVIAPIGFRMPPAPCPDMPIDTYLSTLPLEHREAISRARADAPLDSTDGDLFLKVVWWLTWSPMSEDDKNCLTLELLAATKRAKSWGAAS